ncbi:MAG: TonB-dependent receptor [Gammaproteobacteria bacterium]|nr:TonB-dependent receptor [Gammaproteobacteria bacterium]MDH3372517.1 TonB-dependent receptor [Gammaproteobacteria bacterium]MDH3409291.1 TonB-dependent receptor [Gammaproteobacteria bacterium]
MSVLPFAAADAQQGGVSAMDEVVVTARKRAESLQDVPIAITAFTEETIERAGIERPADFISLMPNVTIVDTANVGDTQVSIRGIVSTRDAESTFAYVVDGILSTNPNSFNEELVDVRQIEVLKGPQGALYGRNAVAGAILVTTKDPGDEFAGKVKVGGGSDGLAKASLRLSGPLGETVRGSIAASYREFDGVYSNIYENAGSDVDYLEDTTVRARLMFEPNDNLSWDVRAGYSDVSGGAINFNAVFAIPAFNAIGSNFFADVNDHDFTFGFNVPGENEQETTEFAVKGDYTTENGDWTFIASYNDLDEYLLSDGTSATFYGYELTPACQTDRASLNSFTRPDLFGDPVSPFLVLPPPPPPENDFAGIYGPYTATACDGYQYQERNQKDTSVEVRFTSPQDQPIRWIAGLYATEIDREVVVAYGADQGLGFLRQPYIDPTGPNPTDLLFWDDFETSVIAAFAEIGFDIGESSELSIALRWDQEDRDVSNQVPNVNASGLNGNAQGPINPAFNTNPGGIPSRSRTFDQLQPKVSWRWAATDQINVYASWGIGFRSGGFNSIGSEDLLNFWFNSGFGGPGEVVQAGLTIRDEYDKEVSSSFELGLKTQLMDNRLRLNAAVFNTEVEDNQFFEFFAGPFGLLRVVTTIDETTIQGFEADFNFLATENFSVFGGIGLLDSEIDKNLNRPLSEGNDVPQAPEETFNLGAQLDFPMGNNMNFYARADFQHVGEMWFHTLQGESTPTIWQAFPNLDFLGDRSQDFSKTRRDSYDTVDLRIGIEGENWSATVWGRNITDEDYLEEVIPAAEFGGSFIHPAATATYGVEFSYSF